VKLKIANVECDNNLVLAPMSGWGDWPLRLISNRHGAGLVCSEFLSVEGLVRRKGRTMDYLHVHPEEHPVSVQLFGNDAERMAGAAKVIEEAGADIVDINFGCPVKKVTKNGCGAALLRTPERIPPMVEAVRKAVSIPVTVKIRAGYDEESIVFIRVGRDCESAGADAITLHPRTRAQGFKGEADWSKITELVAAVSVPVIGNGDVTSPEKAQQMFNETGCAAVMIGRAAVGNPWIFERTLKYLETGIVPPEPTLTQRRDVLLQHLEYKIEKTGPLWGLRQMRSIMPRYVHSLPGAKNFRSQINIIDDDQEVIRRINQFFDEAEEKLQQQAS
jgi:tRNA-dihydrouridine synthase B